MRTQGELETLSQEIDALRRQHNGSTYVDVGIEFSLQTMNASDVDAQHSVIDISGDEFFEYTRGRCLLLKAAAEDQGIRINTLPIIELSRPGLPENIRQSSNDTLVHKFRHEVQTQSGFTEVASGFEAFGDSMARKLRYEVAGLRPSTVSFG